MSHIRRSRAKADPKWQAFERQFCQKHPDFFHTLTRTCPELTRMELRICAMLRDSMFSWEIAERLSIAEHTVENHRSNIRTKLCLKSREHLQPFLFGL